jgi:lipoprotein-releasing system permease protein
MNSLFSPFERLVALRYLQSRRRSRSVSFNTLATIVGIAVGVAILIIVMSAMNGLRHQLLSHILGLAPHVRIERTDGVIAGYETLVRKVQTIPGVARVMPIVDGDVMVTAAPRSRGAMARGIDPTDLRQSAIGRQIVAGTGEPGAVIGHQLARALGVTVGDEITLVIPNPEGESSSALPKSQAFPVVAIFRTDDEKYDLGELYLPLDMAQRFFAIGNEVTSLEVNVTDPDQVAIAKAAILQAVDDGYRVRDWRDLNAALVSALKVEGVVTFILLALVVLVAAFNIVCGQVMLVKDKAREIAILRTLGATRPSVLRIFLLNGAGTGVLGTLMGFVVGLGVAGSIQSIGDWLARVRSDSPVPGFLGFLSQLPAIVEPSDVGIVVALALALSFAATIYPAWQGARLDPVEALRYE